MRFRSLLTVSIAAVLVGVTVPTSARAQTFLFGIMNGTGDLGTSETFDLGGWGSILATASSGYDLWAKNGGYGETGLGLCKSSSITTHNGVKSCTESGNTDTEIGNSAGYIRLSFTTVNASYPPEWFELSSVQPGESYGFRVGTNSNCSNLGSQTTGTGPNDGDPAAIGAQSGGDSHDPFAYRALATNVRCVEIDPIWSQYNGWDEGGSQSGGDFLLYSLTMDPPLLGSPVTVTPEPATMTLMATGLIGMAGAARRRRRK